MTYLQGKLLITPRLLFLSSFSDPAPCEAPGAPPTLRSEATCPPRPLSAPEPRLHVGSLTHVCGGLPYAHAHLIWLFFFFLLICLMSIQDQLEKLRGGEGSPRPTPFPVFTYREVSGGRCQHARGPPSGLVTHLVWRRWMWEPCLLA